MFRSDKLMSELRRSAVADDVMAMIARGTARLKRAGSSYMKSERARSASYELDKDRSLEYVAVLGEN